MVLLCRQSWDRVKSGQSSDGCCMDIYRWNGWYENDKIIVWNLDRARWIEMRLTKGCSLLTRYYLLEICKAELNEMLHLQISVGEGIVSGTLYLLLSSASLAILLRVIWFKFNPFSRKVFFQKPGHAGALFCTKAATIAIAVVLIVTIACQVLLFFVFSLFFFVVWATFIHCNDSMIHNHMTVYLSVCLFECLLVCLFVYVSVCVCVVCLFVCNPFVYHKIWCTLILCALWFLVRFDKC